MKPTIAQQWAAHSLEAIFIGAAANAAINVYTSYQSGKFTLTDGLVILVSVFLSIGSKGVATLLSNPETVQAISDSSKQIEAALTALIQSHATLLNAVTTQVAQTSQPMVIAQPLNQGTLPVQPPMNVYQGMQPVNATATAAPPASVQYLNPLNPGTSSATSTSSWLPPSSDIRFGDSQVMPVVAKP